MYMYRVAVHSLDAEFTVLEMTTSNAFSRELKILYHFIHASILPTYRTRLTFFGAGGELCPRLQFRTRSDRQHELCNYLTFWWCSGLCFEILI